MYYIIDLKEKYDGKYQNSFHYIKNNEIWAKDVVLKYGKRDPDDENKLGVIVFYKKEVTEETKNVKGLIIPKEFLIELKILGEEKLDNPWIIDNKKRTITFYNPKYEESVMLTF